MAAASRRWKPVPAPGNLEGTVLYDGVCVLCSRGFHFVVARDPDAQFRFCQIQDPYGSALARQLGIDPLSPQTNAVLINGVAWFKSDAVLQVLQRLPGWGWTRLLESVPRPLRDFVYDRVAKNRYRMFGNTEHCMIPDPGLQRHVLSSGSRPADSTRLHAS